MFPPKTDEPKVQRSRSSVGTVLLTTRPQRSRSDGDAPQSRAPVKPVPPPPPNDPPPPGRVPAPKYDDAMKRLGPVLKEAAKSAIAPGDKDAYRQELTAANDLRNKGQIDEAVQKLEALEDRIKRDLDTANSAPEGKERGGKKLRSQVAIARQRAENELLAESTLSQLPGGLDLSEIRSILAEHKAAVGKEAKVLDEYEYLDEMLTDKTLKENPKLMQEKLTGIGAAMKAASDRKYRLLKALEAVPKPPKSEPGAELTEDQKVYRDALGLSAQMTAHVPDHWQAQWNPNFAKRIENLTATPEKKAENLEEAKKGFSEEKKQQHRAAMEKGIAANSTKKLDRVEFFFDRMVKAPSPQEMQDLVAVHEEVMEVGTKILDSGGKLSDVRKALAHIPESWWPPAFVDYLQAWRKTEREMSRIRVAKMFEKTDYAETAFDTVNGVVGFLSTVAGISGPVTGLIAEKETNPETGKEVSTPEWLQVEGVQGFIASFTSQLNGGMGFGKALAGALKQEFIQRGNDIGAVFTDPKKLDAAATQLLTLTKDTAGNINTALKAYEKVMSIPSTDELVSTIIPGISIAVCSVDLFLAIKTMAEHSRKLLGTKSMIPKAELAWAMEADEDGGAFVRALGNEVTARKTQVSKDGVNVTEKSINLGGAIAGTVGGQYGLAAQAGLKVVGKVIVYGGKVVFTNIEWSRANTAKELIKQAQAGNPAARIELMSDCGLYAKLYIAILAREGHKLALTFIADRGIEESDLEGGALAMKIVVDHMLKDADQPDETKIADNWAEANLRGLGLGGAIDIGKKVLGGGKAIVDAIRTIPKSSRSTPYDENWKHKPEHVALTAGAWEAGKNEAKAAGLFDYSTGIGVVFGKVEEAYSKLNSAKPGEEKDAVVAVLNRLEGLMGELIAYSPLTNPQGDDETTDTHKGMVLYLAALKNLIAGELSRMDMLLVAKGFKEANWTTDKAALLPDEWNATFADAAEKACLADDDLGVGKAIAGFHKAAVDPALADNNPDKQKRRKATIKAYEAGGELLGALDALFGSARECQGLRDYIDRLKDAAAAQMRIWDEQLVTVLGAEWACPADGFGDDKYLAASWKSTWTQAVTDGVVSEGKKDGGVYDALTVAEAARKDYAKIDQKKDPKDKRDARKELQRKLAHVYAATTKFAAAQKLAVQSMQLYAAAVGKWAQAQIAAVREEQGNVAFAVVEGFDPASFAQTDDNAKKAGAVGTSGGTMKKLENAIKDTVSATADFAKASEKQDRAAERKAATARNKALLEVLVAADNALAAEGYSENKQMAAYLNGIKTKAGDLLKIEVYKSVLEGSSGTANEFDPGPFEWSNDAWQKVKKAAVAAGLMDDAKTGFGEELTKTKEKYEAWKVAEPQEKIKTAKSVTKHVTAAKTLAEKLGGGTENAKLKAYFAAAASGADKWLQELSVDTTAQFKNPGFVWSHAHWQGVKKEAVTRGLMSDKATDLGSKLKKAKAAYKDWTALTPAEATKKKAEVQKITGKLRDIAAVYRDTVSDPELRAYFASVVAKVDERFKQMNTDKISGIQFDPGPFQWSNEAWQKVKKAAIEKAVMTNDTTDFGSALKKAKKAEKQFAEYFVKNEPKNMAKSRKTAAKRLNEVKKIAGDLKAATTHGSLKAYFDECIQEADRRLAGLPADLVDFTPQGFTWSKDHWQKTKKAAVARKLLKDDKSGFGDAITKSRTAFLDFKTALSAGDILKINATREPARAAVVQTKSIAERLRGATEHTKLKAYFTGCVTEADKLLEKLKV